MAVRAHVRRATGARCGPARLVRRAVGAELGEHEPDRERELRRRIVDPPRASHRRRSCCTDRPCRAGREPGGPFGYSWHGSVRHRIDGVRPGDAERVGELLGADAWWDVTRPFFDRAPARVAIARDADEAVCGYSISVTPASAPELAHTDLVLGPWLAHAQSLAPDGNAVLWRDSEDFSGDPDRTYGRWSTWPASCGPASKPPLRVPPDRSRQ